MFKGGWVDLEYWGGNVTDQSVLDEPGWDDSLTIERFGEVLDRFARLFHWPHDIDLLAPSRYLSFGAALLENGTPRDSDEPTRQR